MRQFLARQIFQAHVSDEMAPLAFALLRRIRDAVSAFDRGTELLAHYVEYRRADDYFDARSCFEAAIAPISYAIGIVRGALKTSAFKKGDGSFNERLQSLYNLIKHGDPRAVPPGHVHLLWLENDGIHGAQVLANGRTDHHAVTFEELREEVRDFGKIASDIVDGPPGRGGA
jgi:hypothetical protein